MKTRSMDDFLYHLFAIKPFVNEDQIFLRIPPPLWSELLEDLGINPEEMKKLRENVGDGTQVIQLKTSCGSSLILAQLQSDEKKLPPSQAH